MVDNMSISNFLFGDFECVYSTELPLSDAVGRLASVTDQSTPVERRGISTLQGYVTTHEVVLSRDVAYIFTPFKPIFSGRFVYENGETRLKGRIGAGHVIKLWLSLPPLMAIIFGTLILFGVKVNISGSTTNTLASCLILVSAYALLRLIIRQRSFLVLALEEEILLPIAGHRPNNSFKPNPLRSGNGAAG